MITPSDPEYLISKVVKRGESNLEPEVIALSNWIRLKWGVEVLNIIYDKSTEIREPRIKVILDREADSSVFQDGLNFDRAKQDAIKQQFVIFNPGVNTEGLFVVFSSFERVAKKEINSKVTQNDIDNLIRGINSSDLWTIHKCFGETTFFFYTEQQKVNAEKAGLRKVYSNRYYDLVTKFDEFGYLNQEDFSVNFDSKECFDSKYEGSWFNYDR